MLVLSRKLSEIIVIEVDIGNGETEIIEVLVCDIDDNRVRIGFNADKKYVKIDRKEIRDQKIANGQLASER